MTTPLILSKGTRRVPASKDAHTGAAEATTPGGPRFGWLLLLLVAAQLAFAAQQPLGRDDVQRVPPRPRPERTARPQGGRREDQ